MSTLVPAEAQQTGKIPRIGWLMPNTPVSPIDSHITQAFRQGLRELGWIEGENVNIEYRFAEGKFDRLPAPAAELVRINVDLIFAQSSAGGVAAAKATSTIPVVGVVFDPVEMGLVATLARPGGNFTGLALMSTEPSAKRVQLLKEVMPRLTKIAVLVEPATGTSMLRVTEAAAQALGLKLQAVEVRSPDELESAFAGLMRRRPGALSVLPHGIFFDHRQRLCELAAKNRLPVIAEQKEHAEAGCLMAYGSNIAQLYRRAATYVDKILKGAKPGDLPIEQPTKFEFVINLSTAKALGLTIPQSLLLRADQIIQ